MNVVAFNTTDRPVPIDDEGRTLGGGEFGAVLSTTDEVKAAVDRGELALLRNLKETDDMDPAARDALERVTELEAARRGEEEAAAEPSPAPAKARSSAKKEA